MSKFHTESSSPNIHRILKIEVVDFYTETPHRQQIIDGKKYKNSVYLQNDRGNYTTYFMEDQDRDFLKKIALEFVEHERFEIECKADEKYRKKFNEQVKKHKEKIKNKIISIIQDSI